MPDTSVIGLQTQRLFLRQWREGDLPPSVQLNADPRVMEFYPRPLTREESGETARKIQSLIAERGWGLWAVELKSSGAFVGYVGLHVPSAELSFSPCVEVGWRLSFADRGKGYEAWAEGILLCGKTMNTIKCVIVGLCGFLFLALRFTNVFVQRHGRWQLVAHQSTEVRGR